MRLCVRGDVACQRKAPSLDKSHDMEFTLLDHLISLVEVIVVGMTRWRVFDQVLGTSQKRV